MERQPPKWADRFLVWYCNPDLIEDLQGDLHEIFYDKLDKSGVGGANRLYVWLVLRSFRLSALKRNSKLKNSISIMNRNHFKLAARILWKEKFNTAINLSGLVLGIACFLLLGHFVKQELSYDQMHSKKDRIYRTWLKEDYGDGREFFNSTTPLRFEALLEENFPEIERSVQYIERHFLVGNNQNKIDEKVAVVSSDFFKVFDFEVLDGNLSEPLPTRNDIVLSRAYASKYFGQRDPIGLELEVQIDTLIRKFNVSAVIDNLPRESSFSFDLAISTDNGRSLFSEEAFSGWFTIIPETYVLLNKGTKVSSVESKVQDVIMSQKGGISYIDVPIERGQYNIGFQPLTDIHLNPDVPLGYAPVGNPQYVIILAAIGLLVLIMACVNYTTLSVGQSLKRSKEVGMRKVLGAPRGVLVSQYLSESLLLSFIAMVISVAAAFMLVPIFNELTNTQVFIEFEWWHTAVYLALAVIIGVIAGLYPAVVVSGFKSKSILSGAQKLVSQSVVRQGLVVVQFLITVFLISTVLLMREQLDYLLQKNLGYNYKAVISSRLPSNDDRGMMEGINSGLANGKLLKSELQKHPEISNVAVGSHVFGSNGWAHFAFNDKKGDFKWFRLLIVDDNYLNAFNINIQKGRGFEKDNGLDQRQSVIINEQAVKYFGLENPVGSKLPGDAFGEHQIIGVVDNFHFSSLHTEIEPLVIMQNPMPIFQGLSDGDVEDPMSPKIVFTYSGTNLHQGVEVLKNEWKDTFPNVSWNYEFVDEKIKAQYDNETRLNKLIAVATFLSIVIAVLGLFGLIMIVSNSKIKEIGIRKVLGATQLSIFALLIKGFLIPLVLAIALSVPLTIGLMSNWLENFAYHIDINALPFIASALITVFISALVIGYHSRRASVVNPVDSLRME